MSPRTRILPSLLAPLVLGVASPVLPAQTCELPPRVSRSEILQAMQTHGAYSLTSTTTSMLFGSRALLELVRRRQRSNPGSTRFLIDHAEWFSAHQEVAGVPYAEMSASARAGLEFAQDVLVEYGPDVVQEVVEGPAPVTVISVTIFRADSGTSSAAEFSYEDTLSVPQVDVFNQRVIRFRMLEYDSLLVFDEVSGISVRPRGFLSAVFAVIGKPDLKQTRLAFARDWWQVVRGRVKVLPGISKTGTAAIEPGGTGHEDLPSDRPDLRALLARMRRPIQLRYAPPSCQARLVMARQPRGCRPVMGGLGCPNAGSP